MPARNRQANKTRKEIQKEAKSSKEHQLNGVVADIKFTKPWTPTSYTAFKILLSARLCAAVWSNISDCDEVFNYWEPTHYLLYKNGFQTWEYSPAYAIRSYAYLWLHALPGFIYGTLLQSNKVLVFYFVRCLLGFCSALCEVYFYRAICHHFGANVGRLTLVFLVFGSGMFVSSTAFLPSSFSMYLTMLALGTWFFQKYEFTILATAVSALVGWPFSVILGLPAAYDIILCKKKWLLFLKWSAFSLVLILIPVVVIDSRYFGKLAVAPLNIVLYNVFTSHGANLYGSEPWSFYFLNGFLNFNFVFIFALFSLPVLVLVWYLVHLARTKHADPSFIISLMPLYIWIAVFFPQSHKEERFLFPVYPMICLAGAVTVDNLQKIFYYIFIKKKVSHYLESTNWIAIVLCILYCFVSLSRTAGVYKAYRAPVETFMELTKVSSDEELHPLPSDYPVNICIGKEWYRFPSSFFLPHNWHLQFLKSEFRGQLPKPFSHLPNATQIIPTDMNDQNLEEHSRYVDLKQCDYIVDSDFPSESDLEPSYSRDKQWRVISTIPFLDSHRSSKFLRAFYIPYFTDFRCIYVDYNLLQNTRIEDRLSKKKRKNLHI